MSRETDARRRLICRHFERRGLELNLPEACRNFDLIEVPLAIRYQVNPQALYLSLHSPRSRAAVGLGASGDVVLYFPSSDLYKIAFFG
jgi:hypothetical protein